MKVVAVGHIIDAEELMSALRADGLDPHGIVEYHFARMLRNANVDLPMVLLSTDVEGAQRMGGLLHREVEVVECAAMNDESYWNGVAVTCRRFATEGLTLLELRQLLREAEQSARRQVTRLRAERLGRETIARGETVVEAHHQMPTWEAGPTRAEVEAWQRGGVECEPAWAWRPERPALGLHHGVELLGETEPVAIERDLVEMPTMFVENYPGSPVVVRMTWPPEDDDADPTRSMAHPDPRAAGGLEAPVRGERGEDAERHAAGSGEPVGVDARAGEGSGVVGEAVGSGGVGGWPPGRCEQCHRWDWDCGCPL